MVFHFPSHDLIIMLIGLGIIDMEHETYVTSRKNDLLKALKVTM
jgi:hypothetical protein